MTACPDWRRLAAHRLDPRADEPEGWSEALAHLDGCAACRGEALRADPTLAFRRLRALEMAPVHVDAEADRMRQAVAAMRVASRLDRHPSRERSWRRWAAAAVLAGASLVFGTQGGVSEAPARSVLQGPIQGMARPSGAVVPARLETSRPPLVEDVNRPEARVYQFDGEDLSVVLIVDETLDV